MGNILNEILYKVGIGRKNVKVYTFTQGNHLKTQYVKVSKDRKLMFTNNEIKGVDENIKITSIPIRDDSTDRPCFLLVEGIPGTMDIQTFAGKNTTSQGDDLVASQTLTLGMDIERRMSSKSQLDMKMIYIFIIAAFLDVVIIVMMYMILTNLPVVA